MASSSGIKAGQAFVEIFADDSRLVRGLKAASMRLKAWGQSISSIGRSILTSSTAIIGGLLGATKVFAGMGDNVQKMSLRTGLSVEALSELGFAAEQSGADLASLEIGLRRMQQVIGAAASGSQEASDALSAVGLSIDHLAGRTPEGQFELIADHIAKIKDPTLQAAAAMEIFGRSGTQLLPLLQNGAAGIAALRKQARELGLTISTEDANAAAAITDALNILWRSLKQIVFVLGSALAPLIKEYVGYIAMVIKSVADWIRANKSIVRAIFTIAIAVAAVGAVVLAFGAVVTFLGTVAGTLAKAFYAIRRVLGFLLSPFTLLLILVAGLGTYFLRSTKIGQAALARLQAQITYFRDVVSAAWQAIADALAAGDIGLAVKIFWLTIKLEWQKGIAWLVEKWVAVKEILMATLVEMAYSIAWYLLSAWTLLQRGWTEAVAFMSKIWANFAYSVISYWRYAQTWIAKILLRLMKLVDSSLDIEGALRILEEDFQREQRNRDKALDRQLRDIETARKEKRASIEAEAQEAFKWLEDERVRRHAERKKQYDEEIKAAEDAVAEAQRQWQEARSEAARKRAEMESASVGATSPPGGLEDINFENVMQRAISVTGTFNPMAAYGLGTGGPLERVARAGEETARNTRRLLQQAQRGGLVFS